MKTLPYTYFILFSSFFIVSSAIPNQKSIKLTQKKLNEQFVFVTSRELELDNKKINIPSYIVSKYEVTNNEYQLFLNDLKTNGELQKLAIAQIDSAAWTRGSFSNAKYTQYYHSHPAYANYPVVNVSKEAANLYCEWYSEKMNQNLQQFSKLKFRLPSRAEWINAAKGNLKLPVYAWGGPYLRNSKGQIMCNFLNLGLEVIARNEKGGALR